MDMHAFPVIDLVATGDNIRRLRLERGLSVRDLQTFFGFEQPQAIYKWQKGACLPTVDNLYALGSLFGVPMDQILVPVATTLHSYIEQQESSCCSSFFITLSSTTAFAVQHRAGLCVGKFASKMRISEDDVTV